MQAAQSCSSATFPASIIFVFFFFFFLFFLGDIQLPSSVVEAMQMQVNVEYLNLFFVA